MWVNGHQMFVKQKILLRCTFYLYLYEFWEFFTGHKLLAGGNDCFKMLKYKSNVNLCHESL